MALRRASPGRPLRQGARVRAGEGPPAGPLFPLPCPQRRSHPCPGGDRRAAPLRPAPEAIAGPPPSALPRRRSPGRPPPPCPGGDRRAAPLRPAPEAIAGPPPSALPRRRSPGRPPPPCPGGDRRAAPLRPAPEAIAGPPLGLPASHNPVMRSDHGLNTIRRHSGYNANRNPARH